MSEKSYLQLKKSCISNIPFQTYDEFIFIVNGEEFKTTRIISDLLSPKICKIHLSDPTINQYVINTKHKGDFSQFLKLINFKRREPSDDDIEFITEIIENLGNNSIKFTFQEKPMEMTKENIFKILKKHSKHPQFFSAKINDEIDFISSHFYELFEGKNQYKNLQGFELEIVERIFNNSRLKLIDEDQLLTVINKLYSTNSKYSILYEYVDFKSVGSAEIREFINIFDINDINVTTWKNLSQRLDMQSKTNNGTKKRESKRYAKARQKEVSDKVVSNPLASSKKPNNNDPFQDQTDDSQIEKRLSSDPFSVPISKKAYDPFPQTTSNQKSQSTSEERDSSDPFLTQRSAKQNASSSSREKHLSDDPFSVPKFNFNDPFALTRTDQDDSSSDDESDSSEGPFRVPRSLKNKSSAAERNRSDEQFSDFNDNFVTTRNNRVDPFSSPRNSRSKQSNKK